MLSLACFNSNFNYSKTMEFKDRLKQARLNKSMSQSTLAKLVGVHVTNISRYERGENKPTSQVLTKLADALSISADFLMSGSTQEIADATISDKELLEQFRKVERLPSDKKHLVKEFLDAFLIKTELQQRFAS
ncbi:MAG: helix-turn-helix transcriptional regulator [Bacteroidota bacterium]